MKFQLAVSVFVFASIILPAAAGAPDTPPSLTWESMLQPMICTDEILADMAVSPDGSTYTLVRCSVGAVGIEDDGYILARLNSSGTQVCSQFIVPDASGTESYDPMHVDVDPAGRAWVWYTVSGALIYLDVWGTNCVKAWDNIDDFVTVATLYRTTFEEINATSFKAYTGGPAARIGQLCVNSGECEVTFQTYGNPGIGNVHYAGPYHAELYGQDAQNGGGASEVYLVTRSTGAIADQAGYGNNNDGDGKMWFNPSTDTIAILYPRTLGTVSPRYAEFNKTTLTQTRDLEPIESTVFDYDDNQNDDGFVDGAGSVFYCGMASTPGVKRDVFLSKFNSTVNMGMRWNITVNRQPGLSFERGLACGLSDDGSVYVALTACDTNNANCDNYVRKYAGAGIGRTPQGIFEAFPGAVIVEPPAGTDGGLGFANFCAAIGFTSGPGKFLCGLVIVVSGTLLVAAITKDLSGRAVLIISGITGFGLMLFVTFIELWPIIALALLSIMSAAIVAALTKRQLGNTGG